MAWAGYTVAHTSTPPAPPPPGSGQGGGPRKPFMDTQKYTNILAPLWYLTTLEYTRSSYVNNNKPFHP